MDNGWEADGELVRQAYTLHAEDDDFGQAGTLYREVFDDAARDRFLDTLTGQGKAIANDTVLENFFGYWSTVDADLGAKLRAAVQG